MIIDHLTYDREVTQIPMEGDIRGSLIQENVEVWEAMIRCDRDVWKIKELRDIVNKYMDSSLVHLDSLIALRKCCNHARESRSLISLVLQQFDEEEEQGMTSNSDGVDGQRYAKTQETLAKLMGAGDPFPEDFLMTFLELRHRQISMLRTLKDVFRNLNKKVKGKGIEALRNVLSAMISATSMTLGVCAEGVAEMAVPPVARVVEAGASSVRGLMKVPWTKFPDKGWGISIDNMRVRQHLAICDLDTLEALARRLKFMFNEIMPWVDFAAKGEPVKLCVEGIRSCSKDMGVTLDDLEEHADFGFEQIRHARAQLQQMIWEIPMRD